MRLLLAALLCFALFVQTPFPNAAVQAGDYHDRANSSLNCSECHVMHLSPSTNEGAGETRAIARTSDDPRAPTGTSVGALLRKDVNDLCLSCHDNSGASDVLGPNLGRSPGDVRQGGFLNRMGTMGLPATGHTLDSLETAPGSNPTWRAEDENGAGNGLNCINCHSPHGSQPGQRTYRNLRDDAGSNPPGHGLVTYNDLSPGTNDLGRDVFQRRARSYDESAVDFNEPDPRESAIGRYCEGCHSSFHGAPGSREIGGKRRGEGYRQFLRHPTGGVNIGAVGESWSSQTLFASRTNRVKVMSETGTWEAPGTDLTPTCITCHKAHGNANAFGLIYRSGRGALTENGDTGGSSLEHLCGQCHPQASGFAKK